jgi:glycosyltransferase involved in cell wall biosynthesis
MPTSVPRIHAFHGHLLSEPELGGWKRKLVISIERLLASRAQKIVTVGQKVAFELLQERVGREEQYLSIPPGVIPVDLESRNEALNELGIKDGRPIVAWFARLALVKAPDRAIELARRLPEVQVVVAGGGELLDELRTQRMENLHVVGWQPASRIWSVADIAISTSKNEGMPVALIEAQLAGIPVVGLDVGSVGEVIEDEVTGYVLSHFDDKFIEKVNLLAQDKSLRLKMGEAARKRASILFSPKQLVDSHNTLFQKLLS